MTYQTTIEGIEPRPSETEYGAMVLRMRERFGWARVLKRAPAIRRAYDRRREGRSGVKKVQEAA